MKRTEARALRKLRRPHYQFKLQSYSEHHGGRKVKTKANSDPAGATPSSPGSPLPRPGAEASSLRAAMSKLEAASAASAPSGISGTASSSPGPIHHLPGLTPGTGAASIRNKGVPANQEEQIKAFNRLLEDGFL